MTNATETWDCGWLVDHGFSEDGDPIILPCGAPAREVGEGWECEAGHAHRGIAIEWAEDAAREDAERRGVWA